MSVDWIALKNEYINGNISYRKMAEKYSVSLTTLQNRAIKEKWFNKRKEQRSKIEAKAQQKTVEKISEKEANRVVRMDRLVDKLLDKTEEAIEQLDFTQSRNKRKYQTVGVDENGKPTEIYIEEEIPHSVKLNTVNIQSLKQITTTLKEIKEMQTVVTGEKEQPCINITIEEATEEDVELNE